MHAPRFGGREGLLLEAGTDRAGQRAGYGLRGAGKTWQPGLLDMFSLSQG